MPSPLLPPYGVNRTFSVPTLPSLKDTSLDGIRDKLDMQRDWVQRLSPINARWFLRATVLGLDEVTKDIDTFQTTFDTESARVGEDMKLVSDLFALLDSLLGVVRAVEHAPTSAAAVHNHTVLRAGQLHASAWKYITKHGPLPSEKLRLLRKIFCSLLKCVIKIQALSQNIEHSFSSASIQNHIEMDQKRKGLSSAFEEIFGCDPSKGCEVRKEETVRERIDSSQEC